VKLLILLASLAVPAAAEALSTPVEGSVVRSKEWVIRRGANKEEEFIGDVRYESAGTRLASDWALFSHAERTWQARGSVHLRRQTADGDVFEAQGAKAGHDEDSKRGYLDAAPGGRVVFSRQPPGLEPDRGESGRVTWNGENTVTLLAGAKVWGPRLELAADEAVYEKAEGRLTLNGGRPVLRKVEGEWTTALKADQVVASQSPRRIEARGRVQGWMIFKERGKLKGLAQ
jgi:lipopolysaccharide assembly outer membrane protein LptD (OstA)